MVTAWYDRYLKGPGHGVGSRGRVQAAGQRRQLARERDFPGTGGPVGQLALGPDGGLGATAPTGSTSYDRGGATGVGHPPRR
jgi:hypothetical protein